VTTIGLVGCGFIGSYLALEIQRRFRSSARLIGLYDQDPERAERLSQRLRSRIPVLTPTELIRRCHLIIEAASVRAAEEWIPRAIRHRKAILVLSVGSILRKPQWLVMARRRGVSIYIPSGAICGLDGIRAARLQGLDSVTLTTRKPPKAFEGARGVFKKGIALHTIRKATVLFEGSAGRAAALFPENINVAATLALSGLGPHRTRVCIVADPAIRSNIHEIEASGSFGTIRIRVENRPSSQNPKTSVLAAQSALAMLTNILDPVKIGT
jgi:aspartate dehydrogenase